MTHREARSKVVISPFPSHHRNRSPNPHHALVVTLLLNIRLRAPLLRLTDIVLCLVFRLVFFVASQSGECAPCRSLGPIRYPSAQIAQLALGLLSFTLPVLLNSFLFQTLSAQQASHRLFGGPNRLIPAALAAVGVILRYAAGSGDCKGADFADAVGEVFLSMTFAALLFAMGLISMVSMVLRKPWGDSVKLRRFKYFAAEADTRKWKEAVPCQRCCR